MLTSVAVGRARLVGGEEIGGGAIGLMAARWFRRGENEHEVERRKAKPELKTMVA